jgi:tetratricopeptide (TPR) repeat protein
MWDFVPPERGAPMDPPQLHRRLKAGMLGWARPVRRMGPDSDRAGGRGGGRVKGVVMRSMFVAAMVAAGIAASAALAQTRDQNAELCKNGDPDRAIAACTALIQGGTETTDGVAIAYNNRANAWINKDENDRAIQDLNEAIRLRPNYATAFYNRGIAYSKGKRGGGDPRLRPGDPLRTQIRQRLQQSRLGL